MTVSFSRKIPGREALGYCGELSFEMSMTQLPGKYRVFRLVNLHESIVAPLDLVGIGRVTTCQEILLFVVEKIAQYHLRFAR